MIVLGIGLLVVGVLFDVDALTVIGLILLVLSFL